MAITLRLIPGGLTRRFPYKANIMGKNCWSNVPKNKSTLILLNHKIDIHVSRLYLFKEHNSNEKYVTIIQLIMVIKYES